MIGETLSHYHIEETLGVGGRGTVYRAIDLRDKHPVALRVIHPGLIAGKEAVDRFRDDAARLFRNMTSPHVLAPTDWGVAKRRFYVVTPLLVGSTLNELLARQSKPALPAWVAARMLEAALGLAHAHKRGITHYDIRPSTLYLQEGDTGETTVRIKDFGLMRLCAGRQRSPDGRGFIDPAWLAPEILLGLRRGPPCDVYGIGLVAFLMLTARWPFVLPPLGVSARVRSQAVIDAHKMGLPRTAEANPEVPPDFADLVDRCLSSSQRRRPAEGHELAGELENCLRAMAMRAPSRIDRTTFNLDLAALQHAGAYKDSFFLSLTPAEVLTSRPPTLVPDDHDPFESDVFPQLPDPSATRDSGPTALAKMNSDPDIGPVADAGTEGPDDMGGSDDTPNAGAARSAEGAGAAAAPSESIAAPVAPSPLRPVIVPIGGASLVAQAAPRVDTEKSPTAPTPPRTEAPTSAQVPSFTARSDEGPLGAGTDALLDVFRDPPHATPSAIIGTGDESFTSTAAEAPPKPPGARRPKVQPRQSEPQLVALSSENMPVPPGVAALLGNSHGKGNVRFWRGLVVGSIVLGLIGIAAFVGIVMYTLWPFARLGEPDQGPFIARQLHPPTGSNVPLFERLSLGPDDNRWRHVPSGHILRLVPLTGAFVAPSAPDTPNRPPSDAGPELAELRTACGRLSKPSSGTTKKDTTALNTQANSLAGGPTTPEAPVEQHWRPLTLTEAQALLMGCPDLQPCAPSPPLPSGSPLVPMPGAMSCPGFALRESPADSRDCSLALRTDGGGLLLLASSAAASTEESGTPTAHPWGVFCVLAPTPPEGGP